MKKRFNVAVVGATGAVGSEMLRVLEQRKFPLSALKLLASERSVGRRIDFNGTKLSVEQLTKHSFAGIDVALFSAGASRSLEFAPEAVKQGAVVVDNSSAFRMAPEVPLVVPEVNPHALKNHKGLIANPNCSTIVLVVALKPIHDAVGLKRVTVATYQSASGAGAKAMYQLYEETRQIVRQFKVRPGDFQVPPRLTEYHMPNLKRIRVLPNQIAFNLIPQIDVFVEHGETKEERKMALESRKILEQPKLELHATCVRVPVFVAHSEAVTIDTDKPVTVEQLRAILAKTPGLKVVDDPAHGKYPMPIDSASHDEVFVGRLRQDPAYPKTFQLWLVGDNLRKGAATNAVQIAEAVMCPRSE
ncbi:MAG: aspartate-semialdehyde dehydrogenase [Candidatus Omnitrophica bacterium]|nr:aspartate-semialdehyde dehydrogenase [Candidatus Omnitrophota bacterium]